MLTPLEGAVGTIIEIFHKYSCKEPHHDKLSKGELKCLIQKELGNLLQVSQKIPVRSRREQLEWSPFKPERGRVRPVESC
uniref:S100/CaBP-9k-type calcium binding subdomain domain-containing protein n=1 Tax=Chrysemys picta bellii TaxID=8478 RepID=A0A8C3IN93_CHRPI